jgi:hypothetical protein
VTPCRCTAASPGPCRYVVAPVTRPHQYEGRRGPLRDHFGPAYDEYARAADEPVASARWLAPDAHFGIPRLLHEAPRWCRLGEQGAQLPFEFGQL